MTINNDIAVYDEFRAQLDQFKSENAKLTFDYADPQGNKQARSHIHKLRRTKGAIEKTRKAAKADALEYGRMVDAKARELTSEVEEMINVHAAPIAELERIEQQRVDAINNKIESIRSAADISDCENSGEIQSRLVWLRHWDLTDCDEYEQAAQAAFERSIKSLESSFADMKQREADAEELARLRKEQAEQEQKRREEQIAREAVEREKAQAEAAAKAEREAAEQAKREAEEALERQKREAEKKLQREREEAENRRREAEEAAKRRELELKLEAERAEREKAEAEKRAEQAARETERRLQREAEEKAEKSRIEKERREADERHRKQILAEIHDALTEQGFTEKVADDMLQLLGSGDIPHVTVNF